MSGEVEATCVSADVGATGAGCMEWDVPEALRFAGRRVLRISPPPSPSNASADRSRYEGSHEAVSETTLRAGGADAQGETHPVSAGTINKMHVLRTTVLA
jgi:hypothetical protein